MSRDVVSTADSVATMIYYFLRSNFICSDCAPGKNCSEPAESSTEFPTSTTEVIATSSDTPSCSPCSSCSSSQCNGACTFDFTSNTCRERLCSEYFDVTLCNSQSACEYLNTSVCSPKGRSCKRFRWSCSVLREAIFF